MVPGDRTGAALKDTGGEIVVKRVLDADCVVPGGTVHAVAAARPIRSVAAPNLTRISSVLTASLQDGCYRVSEIVGVERDCAVCYLSDRPDA
jgi:hypothetical protein